MIRHWSRPALLGLSAAALLVVLRTPLAGQGPTTGGLTGMVTDSSGTAIRDVLITLTDHGTGLQWETFSDRRGAFRFSLLQPGDYRMTVEKLAYAPRRIAEIPVRSGRDVHLALMLAPRQGAVQATDETFARAALSGSVIGGQYVPAASGQRLPSARHDVTELARLTSQSTDDLVVEGLPPWLSTLAIDGTTFRPAAHPYLWTAPFGSTGFALSGVGPAELVTNGLDVEWTGAAGAFFSALSRRGTPSVTLDARGHWSGDALPSPSFVDGSALSYNDVQGSVALRSPLLSDSARISVGLDIRRLETPVSAAWADSPAAAALIGAGQSAGLDLTGKRSATLAAADAVSGFGRFDWPISPRHQVAGWLHVSSMPKISGFDPLTGMLPELEGTDLIAGASLASVLGVAGDNDLRVGITTSSRRTAELAAVAPTVIVGDGLAFGGPTSTVSGDESRVLFRDALHLQSGSHGFKIGAAATITTHRYEYRQGADGEFYFSGTNDLTARRGALLITDGPEAATEWTTAVPSFFIQDRWAASEGVDILLGVQLDREPLPTDRVRLDNEWQRLAGIANNAVQTSATRPAVRAGFVWDVRGLHQWVVQAGAAVHYDRMDPLLLSQWQSDAGEGRSRREVGIVAWPDPAAGAGLRHLTLLSAQFEAPRTNRLSAGLVHRLAPHTSLHLSGVVRRTEHLPRRSDLNLLPLPVARDQYGRAVYGTLVQQGAMLVAQPGSNRRFDDYEDVAAVAADGRSDYWGLTVGIEREVTNGIGVIARYTYGRTTDNWFAGREGGWTAALPRGLDTAGEWADATSDFDFPHRAVAGFVLNGPLGTTLGAVYRFQSGQPFTPGFRTGVDADGDGQARLDPAFVDASLVGMGDVIARWPCLRESSGRIAERNSCRADATHALDVSLALRFLRVGNSAAAVIVDAFDLLEAGRAQPDNALLLVDAASSLTSNPVARTVNVPYIVNPNFGNELVRPHAGRKLRLGLSLNW